jgi:putative transposase
VNANIESYLQGVSTRKVQDVISHLGIDQISPSYVSKVAQELDEQVRSFLERPIDSHIPYLFVDASYFKVRDGIKYVNKALLVVVGVRTDGYREIFGAHVADAEHELTWEGRFSDIKDRGLSTVDFVISDGHKGIQSAAERCSRVPHGRHGKCKSSFPIGKSQISRVCYIHFIRAVLRKVSEILQKDS